MTTKPARRLRIRKKREGVDQALIDKLVEQGIAKRGKELVKTERAKIREAATKEGVKKGRSIGYNEGYSAGTREGRDATTKEFKARALRPQSTAAQFQTEMMSVTPGNPRYENLNNGWGFLTPASMQRECDSANQVYIVAAKPELFYEYRADVRLRVFELRIWKAYQGGETKKIEIVCNFSEEAMQMEEGAGALLNFLCIICVEGAKYMDAALLCEYMADWVTTTRGRDEGPTIHVPKSARPTALAKFRDAIGLRDE